MFAFRKLQAVLFELRSQVPFCVQGITCVASASNPLGWVSVLGKSGQTWHRCYGSDVTLAFPQKCVLGNHCFQMMTSCMNLVTRWSSSTRSHLVSNLDLKDCSIMFCELRTERLYLDFAFHFVLSDLIRLIVIMWKMSWANVISLIVFDYGSWFIDCELCVIWF